MSAATKGWDRREFLGGLALFALVVGVPAATIKLSHLDPDDLPTDRQRAMVRDVSQLVLPRTDTAGAGETGVGDFLVLALAHGLDGTREPVTGGEIPVAVPEYRRRDGTLRYLDWLEGELDRRANGDWMGKDNQRRLAALTALDADAFADGSDHAAWKQIKDLILTGYYTSETGGSKELRYELVPGRYDPDIPLQPGDRAWSSDWTAVEFG